MSGGCRRGCYGLLYRVRNTRKGPIFEIRGNCPCPAHARRRRGYEPCDLTSFEHDQLRSQTG